MKAYRIKYRAKSGISISPIEGEDESGVLIVRHPHGYIQNIPPKEWDATFQGALEKAKALKCKKRELLRRRMDKLDHITIVTWSEKCQS